MKTPFTPLIGHSPSKGKTLKLEPRWQADPWRKFRGRF